MRNPAPSSWEELSLGDLVTRLVNGGTPPTSIAGYWRGGTPWITGADFTPSGLSEFRRFVSDEAVRETATNVIAKGELLLVTRTGVGKLAIAPCDVAISQDITGVYPDRQRVAVEFLYHRMRQGVEDLKKLNQGTSINGIMRKDLVAYPIVLPPLPQQERIAEILTTVDEAIEQTEALIAKTQQIKAGLMHDLFTRGVTADGQLRPRREEARQLYKESPLGWIPREWGCETLHSLLAPVACPMRSGPFGSALLKEELVENGIPLLGIDNVFAETFVAEYRRFVTPHKFVELSRYAVLTGDVIITIMGTVGRSCVVPEDIDQALSSKHLWTMTFDRNKVLPELVCWQLNYAPWVKSWFARQSQGAVMDAIQSSTLRTLRLPVPPPSEQVLLRDRYVAIQARLSEEDESLRKLRKIKRGLMQDLLMGAVSVEIDPAPEPKEVAANV